MEKRDLYDINKKITGETIYKGDAIPDGRYIIVVLSFIQNSKGDFLIQKRSKEKNGLYASTGGHAKSGESSIQAIKTEIKEEINLDVEEKELELVYSGIEKNKHVFFDIYYIKKDFDIKDLILQKEEVESVYWMSISEIEELINNKEFFKNHAEEFYRVLDFLKKRGNNIE